MFQHEWIVGFDARREPATLDTARSARYLIRQDVRAVLSVDEYVWPPVFATEQQGYRNEPEMQSLLSLPKEWIGPNRPCWESLPELEDYLALHADMVTCPYWLIAITYLPGTWDEAASWPHHMETTPKSRSDGWQFLGFDIADGFISGLSNTGYRPGDFEGVPQSYWSARLNHYHLFGDAADARAFREFSDRRIPSHAPFVVYGLYLICIQEHLPAN